MHSAGCHTGANTRHISAEAPIYYIREAPALFSSGKNKIQTEKKEVRALYRRGVIADEDKPRLSEKDGI